MLKFEPQDILILGDSFARERDLNTDWPKVVSKLLTGKDFIPRGAGYSGASWWSVRKKLLKELTIAVPKVLIICHTECARIPSDYDFGINTFSALRGGSLVAPQEYKKEFIEELRNAAKQYYMHLHSNEFSLWAKRAWFRELDEIIEQHKISHVIHLHCFSDLDDNLYEFKYGITSNEALVDICDIYKPHRNHFTLEENIIFGTSLYEIILDSTEKHGLIKTNLLKT